MERRHNDEAILALLDEIKKMQAHAEPSAKTLAMFDSLNDKLQSIEQKLDDHVSEARSKLSAVDDVMKFGKIGTAVFNFVVKAVVGLGIMASAIYGVKAWVLK